MSDEGSGAVSGGESSVSQHSPASSQMGEGASEGREEGQSPAKPPKMRKVKVNGQERFVSEDQVFRDYQKYESADLRLKEVAKKEQFFRDLEENPEKFFNDPKLSAKKKEWAMQWLAEDLDDQFNPKDPKDIKMSELERELNEFRERDRQAQEETEQTERQKFVESRKTAISQTLHEAMQLSHLSGHPESAAATLREMALYMRVCKENGTEVTAQDLVAHVHQSRFSQMYMLAQQFKGPELIEFLGPEVIKRIREADLSNHRASRNNRQPQEWRNTESSSSKGSQPSFIDPNELRWKMRNGN